MVARFRLHQEKEKQGCPDGTTNYVNVRKLVAVLQQKIVNSQQADSSMGFFFMCILFIVIVLTQRNASHFEESASAVRHYVRDAQYRDPTTFEMKTLMDVHDIDDFWNWHQFLLIEQLFRPDGTDEQGNKTGTVLLHNRLTGGIRIVQRRARNGTCHVIPHLQPFAPDCYGQTYWEGAYGDVDTQTFKGKIGNGRYSYRYQTVDLGFSKDFGYFQDLERNYSLALKQLDLLRQDGWLNKGTQFVRSDFTTFNSNTGTFIAVQIKFWFMASGNLVVRYHSTPMIANLYASSLDYLRIVAEVLLVLSWISMVLTEFGRFASAAESSGKLLEYFAQGASNWIKVAQILVWGIIFGLWVTIVLDSVRGSIVASSQEIKALSGQPIAFHSLARLERAYFFCCGIQIFLCLLRTLTFLSINYTLSKLTKTFSFIAGNIVLFLLVLMVLISGFLVAGHVMFGDREKAFATLSSSLSTTLNGMANGMSYKLIHTASSTAAPIFFYPMTIIVLFLCLNVTIVIILEGYAQAQEERAVFEKGDLADLCSYDIFTQIYRGTTRRLTYIRPLYTALFRPLLSSWARFRLESRYTKTDILIMLRGLETNEHIDFFELERHIDESFRAKLTSEQLVDIVTSQNAWVTEAEERARGHMLQSMLQVHSETKTQHTLVSGPIQQLRETLETLAKDKHDMQAKLERILKLVPATPAQRGW